VDNGDSLKAFSAFLFFQILGSWRGGHDGLCSPSRLAVETTGVARTGGAGPITTRVIERSKPDQNALDATFSNWKYMWRPKKKDEYLWRNLLDESMWCLSLSIKFASPPPPNLAPSIHLTDGTDFAGSAEFGIEYPRHSV